MGHPSVKSMSEFEISNPTSSFYSSNIRKIKRPNKDNDKDIINTNDADQAKNEVNSAENVVRGVNAGIGKTKYKKTNTNNLSNNNDEEISDNVFHYNIDESPNTNDDLYSKMQNQDLKSELLRLQKQKERLKEYKNIIKKNYYIQAQSGLNNTRKVIEADQKKLDDLVLMGFEEERCRKALVVGRNNMEHATELLLGGSNFELYDNVYPGYYHQSMTMEPIRSMPNINNLMYKDEAINKVTEKRSEEDSESRKGLHVNGTNL